MAKKSCMLIVSLFIISAGLLYSMPQAMAETLSYKFFLPVTQRQIIPIGDVEGHAVGILVREGAIILENGEMAWGKAVVIWDMIKGAGRFDQYSTLTFQDGSTIITRTKGTAEATSSGVSTAATWTGEIIKGTGRFEGIKGTGTSTAKLLPPGKDELGGKSLGEGTLTYTLPKK